MLVRQRLAIVVMTLLSVFALVSQGEAEEAIARLPGLELWLDAGHEAKVRDAGGAVGDGSLRLDKWHDRSPAERHAVQHESSSQPSLVKVELADAVAEADAGWLVRFDGEDDHLRVLDANQRMQSFTLFVVASPASNAGGFRAFCAANQRNRRDYETGFNLDMNASFSATLHNVNLEGRGFGGARDLVDQSVPFGTLHVLEAVVDAAQRQVRLAFDGELSGQRPYEPAELAFDELTIGARHYENSGAAQRVQGFLHGDIAELLLFSRALSESERKHVRTYLEQKHAALADHLAREVQQPAENVQPLVTLENPPLVQMFVPGFSVRELPLELPNINNLRYRPDGKLYALGYNGDIWLLHDADGDGLEDSAAKFFDGQGSLRGPIGMAVLPDDHPVLQQAAGKAMPAARGVVVASKGKISAILDLDGDDVADQETVIATGWKEIPQNVDAVGVAIHPDDGSIYFGLGTAAFNNAYLLNEQGESAFDLNSERGTIQRILPDLSGRETVCTGVRFTIGMAFNADNQLFVTDQEGATWLPNGNPFDELLHIRPGRHYGFPPRHPRHLPRVFDEPSEYDYGPQHQSTCGLVFNLPLNEGGRIFGPGSWRGDAIVCGESRGKLYRTKLVRDASGRYVASNQLIASLGMLTVDCCLSPRGDLLVACHSGGPDWGTGPSGIGKLFLIRYTDADVPQPRMVWASGEREVQVRFDRPLDPEDLKGLVDRVRISYGEYVAAGDRFETLRPGYAITEMQQAAARYKLPVYSASITPDRKTLVLATARHPAAVHYALTLPAPEAEETDVDPEAIEQHPTIDLAYSLSGVAASWTSRGDDRSQWHGWLPHVDLEVARELTAAGDADRPWQAMRQPGTLTLSTRLDLRGLFLPATQPMSKLDYDQAEDMFVERRTLRLRSRRPFSAQLNDAPAQQSTAVADAVHQLDLRLPGRFDEAIPLTVNLPTGEASPTLHAQWVVQLADQTTRSGPFALHRLLLPWAELERPETPDAERQIPEVVGADWGRGRRVFYSEEAACGKCHVAHGEGGNIGPDLSNLVHRDYQSVLRDVAQPNFAINPDYITYHVELEDGRLLSGALRSEQDRLLIGDKDGKVIAVARDEVVRLEPSSVSVMPEDLPRKLGAEKTRDLLAFLLREPPRMPRDAELPPPAARRRSEVAAVLAGSTEMKREALRPLSLLLVAGAKDHGPGEHDYPAWLNAWSQLLAAAERVSVETAMEWPSDEQIKRADTIVFYQRGSWNEQRAAAIDAHLANGGGLVYIHWAVEGGANAPEFAKRIGLASEAAKLSYRHGPLPLSFRTGADHPIGRNFDRVQFYDESYWRMQGERSRIRVIGTGVEEGEPRPLFWTFEPGQGRVFVSIPGHYCWTFDDPLFRVLLLRGIAWSAGEPVDRFNELVWLGATVAD